MKVARLPLKQSSPGHYTAELNTSTPGAWNFDLTIRQDGQTTAQQSRAIVTGQSDALRLKPVNTTLLQQLASTTGGLSNPPVEQIFQPSEQHVVRPRTLKPWLLKLAALLLIPDTALRRLELRRKSAAIRRG